MASGLPGSPDETIGAIKDIIQDAQGYMWFAGEFGLARYDSHNFRFYYYDSKIARRFRPITCPASPLIEWGALAGDNCWP